jgi:hypothetical protein
MLYRDFVLILHLDCRVPTTHPPSPLHTPPPGPFSEFEASQITLNLTLSKSHDSSQCLAHFLHKRVKIPTMPSACSRLTSNKCDMPGQAWHTADSPYLLVPPSSFHQPSIAMCQAWAGYWWPRDFTKLDLPEGSFKFVGGINI